MAEVYICVALSDGSVVHIAYQTEMRAPKYPGGPWVGPNALGVFTRDSSDANIEYEVSRAARHWRQDGKETVSWRRLSDAEHQVFNQDRDYRNALEDVGGKLQHNMVKARELHKAVLRHWNGDKLLMLDREWVDASADGKKADADAVQAKRQALRDFVNDPRIDAAQTLAELKALVPPEV